MNSFTLPIILLGLACLTGCTLTAHPIGYRAGYAVGVANSITDLYPAASASDRFPVARRTKFRRKAVASRQKPPVAVTPAPAATEGRPIVTTNGRTVGQSVRASTPNNARPLKPFTTEWWAHENAVDAQLRKSMIICPSCL